MALIYNIPTWDTECSSLASSILSAREHISPCQSNGNALFLDGRGLLKAFLKNAHQKLALKEVVLEIIAFGSCNILKSKHTGLGRCMHQRARVSPLLTSVLMRVSFAGRFSFAFHSGSSLLGSFAWAAILAKTPNYIMEVFVLT